MKSSKKKTKRVIAILGMHRGGTSAITRGLRCLGVELGDQLLQGDEGQNPRGFFEDEPLLEISDRVLEVLGISWESTRLIAPIEWKRPEIDRLRIEAAESIERRFESVPSWGFKNPRTARLLPFWQSVFSLVDRSDSYVITLRNPLSVARSLKVRNGFSERRSYMLWLIHHVQSVAHTKGKPRVCVDFDLLLENPATQLRRLAKSLSLPRPTRASLDEYASEFLSSDLRHSRFDAEDVRIDPELSELGRRAYEILRRWASDEDDTPSKIDRTMRQIERRLFEISPVFTELDDLEARVLQERGAHEKSAQEWQEERQGFIEIAANRSANKQSLEREISRMVETLDVSNAGLSAQQSARVSAEERASALENVLADKERSRHELENNVAGLADEKTLLLQEMERLQSLLRTRESEVEALDQRIELERRETRDQLQESLDRLIETERRHEEVLSELDGIRTLRNSDVERLTAQIDFETSRARGLGDRSDKLAAELDRERQRFKQELENRERLDQERLEARERDLKSRLDAVIEAHEVSLRDARAWAVARVPAVAASIRRHADATSQTRTWRVARRLQRMIDRLRWRSPHDGLQHVIHLAQLLEARTTTAAPDIRELASRAEVLSSAVHQVLGGEIASNLRLAARSVRRLVGLPVVSGPADRLFDEATGIAYFLNQLRESPFVSPALRAVSEIPRAAVAKPPILVDVVVPVYGARAETRRCLESLLRAKNAIEHEIVVIDDGNRDSKLLKLLGEHAQRGRVTLLRNSQNEGFPKAANRGMTLHPDRDVVLLNSDTRVSDHWLDRLRRAARSDWRIATATPFSNDGEICSWPKQTPPSSAPDDQELDRLNSLIVVANDGRTLTIPTAVGFCVYITREAIQDVGLFDAECFGRGYGEESDFCMRARAIGYRNVLAADVYVAHEGNRSFGSEREERKEQAARAISLRHPQYAADVERFIATDPAKPLRRMIQARVGSDATRLNILMISHDRGGGTQRHIEEMSRALDAEGIGTLLLQPTAEGSVRLALEVDPSISSDDMVFNLESEMASLVETLRAMNVRHIHIHHILDHPFVVTTLPRSLGLPFDVTLHDYFGICPRMHLSDGQNRYCGEPDEAQCNTCVEQYGSELGNDVDVASWRSTTHDWLGYARRIFVPSADTAERFSRYFPDLTFSVRPHPTADSNQVRPPRAKGIGTARRVAVLGAINSHKGSEIIVSAIRDADRRRLPLRFVTIGYTDRDDELENSPRASVSGPYDPENLPRLLKRSGCDLAFLPSSVPETFSYALSEAVSAGLFPVAFAIGAQAERIRECGWGQLLSVDLDATEINDALLAVKVPASSGAVGRGVGYESMLRDYYDTLDLAEPVHSD